MKKQQQKKAIFSILSPNSNIHERLQFFFSSCMAISNVLPWQYQGYVHRNVKASMAISRLLRWQYQGCVHRNIKATPMALSNFRGNVKATSIPWQYHGYFHQPVSRQPTAAVVQTAIIIIFQLFPQYPFHSKKQNTQKDKYKKNKKKATALTQHSLEDLQLEEGKRKAGVLMRHDMIFTQNTKLRRMHRT